MSKILDSVVSYEEQLVDYVKKARKPVTDYVAKGVKLVETRLPEVNYPKSIATPIEVVERSEEHTSELQSLMRISYAVFCLKKNTHLIDSTNYKKHSKTYVNQ